MRSPKAKPKTQKRINRRSDARAEPEGEGRLSEESRPLPGFYQYIDGTVENRRAAAAPARGRRSLVGGLAAPQAAIRSTQLNRSRASRPHRRPASVRPVGR